MFSAERKLATLKSSQYLTGTGMYIQENKKKNLCTYWDDPNELVMRLQLLWTSKLANHSGHDNEITRLEELLRKKNFIK